MNFRTLRRALRIALLGTFLLGRPASAQAAAAQAYILRITDASPGTPSGIGLLPTALGEAQVVAQHVVFATQEGTNLEGVKRHLAHILHSLDPALVQAGPGLGYGLRRAAVEVAEAVELAASGDEVSDNVSTHAAHVAACALSTVARADAVLALAREIEATDSEAEAAPLLRRFAAQANGLLYGLDLDRDGLVGWRGGEGGLRQANYHMNLMKRGEGLSR